MLHNLDTIYYKPDLVRISQPKLISVRTFFWFTEEVGYLLNPMGCRHPLSEGRGCENPVKVQVMAACGMGQRPGPYKCLGHKIVSYPTLSTNVL